MTQENDRQFLMEIHKLLEAYGHNPLFADMYRLRSLIMATPETNSTETEISSRNRSLEDVKNRLLANALLENSDH